SMCPPGGTPRTVSSATKSAAIQNLLAEPTTSETASERMQSSESLQLMHLMATNSAPTIPPPIPRPQCEKTLSTSCAPGIKSDPNEQHRSATQQPINGLGITKESTPCSLAFSILFSHDHAGCNEARLDESLRKGYIGGFLVSEGYRVRNDVLLKVLAEIS
ncbi:MAG: hypothetical protein M1820_009956, partial [Bogoriella megaspora]